MPNGSLYPEVEDQSSEMEPEESGAESPETETEDEGSAGETALIPKSMLAGKELKPGETVSMKVVHVYEDEVEVELVSGDDGSATAMPPSGGSQTYEDELDAMAT